MRRNVVLSRRIEAFAQVKKHRDVSISAVRRGFDLDIAHLRKKISALRENRM